MNQLSAGQAEDASAHEASRDRAVAPRDRAAAIRALLNDKVIVLVGLMGAGKSTVGKRLAERLSLPFIDSDAEIEQAAGMPIPEIFRVHGEPAFRDGERKVIARLLQDGPLVVATGGGAYMNAQTRDAIASRGISVWLKADLPVLMRRVRRRANRPLLQAPDPEAVMRDLIAQRYPIYAGADVTVVSADMPHDHVAAAIEIALLERLGGTPAATNGVTEGEP